MIHQQQRFLESLDAKERQRSLIITGPPEDRDDLGATDDEKVMNVMNANAGAQMSRVYIKKDVHLAIRRETARLQKREREEREKAENAGCGVLTQHTVDAGTTVVMGDFNATVGEWVPVMLSADGDPGSKDFHTKFTRRRTLRAISEKQRVTLDVIQRWEVQHIEIQDTTPVTGVLYLDGMTSPVIDIADPAQVREQLLDMTEQKCPRVPRWDPDHALQNIPRQDGTSRNAGHCSRGCETLLWEPEDRTSRNAGHCSRGCETLLWEESLQVVEK
ncbi:hypothetical protein O3P69_011823 [Scylla paramamosain]|uniref:Endonuclease/exonuclease/phosphatase domain-containing protein n=1 Tax=Scylla paramamosain TaxID=85552 RepID=A0AAW0SF82_SCYPA